MSYQLIDTNQSFGQNADGLFVHHKQELTTEFLDSLKSERAASAHMRTGELNHVASVPTFVVELWMRQGFNIYHSTPREVVSRLKRDGLDAFLTTDKSV